MAADLLYKKEIPSIPLERGGSVLFYLSLLAFFAIAASTVGLILLNTAQKEAQATLQAEVDDKEKNLKSDLNEIFSRENSLKNIRAILSEHLFLSNTLKFLETHTLVQVRFQNFSFDASTRKLDMTGDASSYSVVSRQIGIFERDPQVERVEFGGLSLSAANLAGFKVSIIFKKPFLVLRP